MQGYQDKERNRPFGFGARDFFGGAAERSRRKAAKTRRRSVRLEKEFGGPRGEPNLFRRSHPTFPHSSPTNPLGELVVSHVPDACQLIVFVILQPIISSQCPSSVCVNGPFPYVSLYKSASPSLTILLLFPLRYTLIISHWPYSSLLGCLCCADC